MHESPASFGFDEPAGDCGLDDVAGPSDPQRRAQLTPPNLAGAEPAQGLAGLRTGPRRALEDMLGWGQHGEASARDICLVRTALPPHETHCLVRRSASSRGTCMARQVSRAAQDEMTTVAAAGHADADKAAENSAPKRSKSRAAPKRRTRSKGGDHDHKHLRETFGRRKSLASACYYCLRRMCPAVICIC